MDKTTVYLSEDIRIQLEYAARRENRSQAEVIREALSVYLSERPAVGFGSIGAGSDAQVTGASSERWLKQNWKAKRK